MGIWVSPFVIADAGLIKGPWRSLAQTPQWADEGRGSCQVQKLEETLKLPSSGYMSVSSVVQ